jgi:hypothetical protein
VGVLVRPYTKYNQVESTPDDPCPTLDPVPLSLEEEHNKEGREGINVEVTEVSVVLKLQDKTVCDSFVRHLYPIYRWLLCVCARALGSVSQPAVTIVLRWPRFLILRPHCHRW